MFAPCMCGGGDLFIMETIHPDGTLSRNEVYCYKCKRSYVPEIWDIWQQVCTIEDENNM